MDCRLPELENAVEETKLAIEFFREEIVTEDEVNSGICHSRKAARRARTPQYAARRGRHNERRAQNKLRRRWYRKPGLASMLMRMYLREAEKNGYKTSIANLLEGETRPA